MLDVPLVQGKPALVRVFGAAAGTSGPVLMSPRS